jgi:hypothetical protein
MLNNLILPNNPLLFQYSHQSFTCDNCQQEFQQSSLYSAAQNKQELSKQKTYCSNCTKPSLLVPTSNGSRSKKKPQPRKNPVAYYQCMSACCQQGISPKRITQIAHECKHNSLGVLSERTQEISKLNEAYRQIGESLTNLLQPIKEYE